MGCGLVLYRFAIRIYKEATMLDEAGRAGNKPLAPLDGKWDQISRKKVEGAIKKRVSKKSLFLSLK